MDQQDIKGFGIGTLKNILGGIVNWFACSPWRSFGVIFLVAVSTQYIELNKIPSRYLIPNPSRELPSIAISLMETGQFVNPYLIPTGPTAHLPPIIPHIYSLIYRWFGLTERAGYVSGLFIITTGAMLYALLPWLSDQLGLGRQAGFFGGLTGALLLELYGHGEFLTGLFLGLILVAFLRRWTEENPTWQGSFLLGVAIGITFHVQPAILPVILGCLGFEVWRRRKQKNKRNLGVMILGIVLICIPWTWRNYRTFNTFFFIRSNFGLEMRMGNHEGAVATMEEMDALGEHRHPGTHFPEVRKLREVGEIEYMRQAGQEAFDWIKTHPGDFLWLTVQRIANLWVGPLHRPRAAVGVFALTVLAIIGAWLAFPGSSVPQRVVLLLPLATYPVIYYFVAYMPRYRVPIDWILYILAGNVVYSLIKDPICISNRIPNTTDNSQQRY